MNEEFAQILAAFLEAKFGEFMMTDTRSECRETEVTRVFQMGKYINVDLDNGMRFRIVVDKT